ncbi:pentatricopeptide repeat-containing protein At3g02650, mitochondrial [Mangifera indica]|uniref:pentatricopeptide repeat-containing protein At3g02650, mitochondrial n=1 Tax=Mangifera indica TaxID=29780 RepID=UPI001CFACCAA|nr:pentatricopeptide repeat-containing protein At3g02650, mitochondrial [Mangifera indica]
MWRSIAARATRVARNFHAANKVQSTIFFPRSSSKLSLYQIPRAFSQLPVTDPSDETDLSSPSFTQNEYSQMDPPVENSDIVENDDTQIDNSMLFSENDSAQLDNFSAEEGEGEPEVYETDMEKLEKVLSLLKSNVDDSVESILESFDLNLHEEFVVKVLETPEVLCENLIGFFKWVMKQPDFKVTTGVVDALVRAVCGSVRKEIAYALWDLVKEIGQKKNGLLNVESLNELIALLSKLGKGKAAFEVFNKFGDFGCDANEETYYLTMEALCKRSFFDWAWSVCEKMIDTGRLPDTEKVGKIISWLCKGSKAKEAHLVYMLAKEKNKCPPQSSSSVYSLISSLCKKDETVNLALRILDDFSGEARKYGIKPFSSVIRSLCRMKDVDGAKILLSKMISDGPPPGNVVFNSIINGYSKAGDMKQAMEMMKMMESRGLKPDVFTYTVIMSGYANGGQMKEACEILSEAKMKHSRLSPVTYHTLIRGYCKLEEFDNALKLLNEMKDAGVQPNVDEYNKLIQSLCLKAVDWKRAEKLLEEMKAKGLHLNGITRALIRAVKELEEEVDDGVARIEA